MKRSWFIFCILSTSLSFAEVIEQGGSAPEHQNSEQGTILNSESSTDMGGGNASTPLIIDPYNPAECDEKPSSDSSTIYNPDAPENPSKKQLGPDSSTIYNPGAPENPSKKQLGPDSSTIYNPGAPENPSKKQLGPDSSTIYNPGASEDEATKKNTVPNASTIYNPAEPTNPSDENAEVPGSSTIIDSSKAASPEQLKKGENPSSILDMGEPPAPDESQSSSAIIEVPKDTGTPDAEKEQIEELKKEQQS